MIKYIVCLYRHPAMDFIKENDLKLSEVRIINSPEGFRGHTDINNDNTIFININNSRLEMDLRKEMELCIYLNEQRNERNERTNNGK